MEIPLVFFMKSEKLIDVLKHLMENNEENFTKLRYCTKPYIPYPTLERMVFYLENYGLVETYYSRTGRRMVKITDKGRKFFIKLMELNKVMLE